MNRSTHPSDTDLPLLERVLRFQEGSLPASEVPDFEHAFCTAPQKRRLFLDAQERSIALRNDFLAKENKPRPDPLPVRTRGTLFSTPIWAAAAGLVIGLFSATPVSGEPFPFRGKPPEETRLPLIGHAAPPPLAIPETHGVCSGEYTEVVPAQDGITPLSGTRMLRIRRADHVQSTELATLASFPKLSEVGIPCPIDAESLQALQSCKRLGALILGNR